MQGISSSDEDAFDDDASAYSSSGNDSDIVRAISADIVMDGESNRCLGLYPPAGAGERPTASGYTRPQAQASAPLSQ